MWPKQLLRDISPIDLNSQFLQDMVPRSIQQKRIIANNQYLVGAGLLAATNY